MRLAIGFLIPIAMLVIVVAIQSLSSNNVLASFVNVSDVSLPLVTWLEELKFAGSRVISSTNEFIVDETLTVLGELDPEFTEGDEAEDEEAGNEVEQIEAAIATYSQSLQEYRSLITGNGYDAATLLDPVDAAGQRII